MDRENLEDSKNEIKQLKEKMEQQKEKIQKQEEEMERMRKALNEGQSSSAGAGTSSAKSSASFSDQKIPVRARLSLCESVKYAVTLGEIERRVTGLEKFTANEYLSFLRTRKDAGKKHKLVGEIIEECFGPDIAAAMKANKVREHHVQTCFTPLTEGEACKLADDFRSIIKKHYPSDAIARQIGSVGGQDVGYTQQELFKFRELLGRVLDIHKSDPSLLACRSPPSAEKIDECLLPNEIQMGFNAVSELTHGFGRIATETVLQMLDEVLEHCASHSAV